MADLNTIWQYMLSNLSDEYDKTVGYPSADFVKAFASGVQWLDARTNTAWNMLDVGNMSGTILDNWCYQRKGLKRKTGSLATATLTATLSQTPATITAGTKFATINGLVFLAIQDYTLTSSNNTFEVQSDWTGEEYNVAAGTITVIPSQITGVSSVINNTPATGGDDGEDDDELRERYYLAVQNGANGTNVGSYVDWACEVPGVHYAKCLPCTPSAGQCKVLIVDEHGNPATSLVDDVQELIDPNQDGDGAGRAPMGCICNVEAPGTVGVVITINSYSGAVSEEEIQDAVYNFAADMALKEEVFSYGRLNAYLIKNLSTLEEIDFVMNGYRKNVQLGANKVPLLYFAPIYITSQPQSVSAAVGDTVSFSVVAEGGELTYQWQYSSNHGTTWANTSVSGNKTSTITMPATAARNGMQYRCKITCGNYIIYSDAATLTVS